MNKLVKNNVVVKGPTRLFQSETLKSLADAILTSAGPKGSATKIILTIAKDPESPNKSKPLVKYTKDGHTILSYINNCDNGLLCNSVAYDVYDITSYVKKKNGDGSTGAVNQASIIFDKLIEMEAKTNLPPRGLIRQFQEATNIVSDKIKSHTQDFTPEEAYNIAYIASNGDKEVAANIGQIYKEFGKDVYIDVDISRDENSKMKILDGMTINTGFNSPAYINNMKKSTATIQKPRIYYFKNAIDTPEQIELFASIIVNNIMTPYETRNLKAVIPTVILAPHLANDTLVELQSVINIMNMYNSPELIANKPPLLVVTNIYTDEATDDIAKLCGCPVIRKYQSSEQMKRDREAGKAPTPQNVVDWYGTADIVESDAVSTKVIRPKHQFSTKGEERKRICLENSTKFVPQDDDAEEVLSAEYNALITALEAQLAKEKNENATADIIGGLMRRINSLKSKVVIYQVGGISTSERDSIMDLVRDAVRSCRSAASSGVGIACNMEGYFACKELLEDDDTLTDLNKEFIQMIKESYEIYICKLYKFSFGINDTQAKKLLDTNSREKIIDLDSEYEGIKYSNTIKTTIDSDIIILEAISKIVTLMMTTSQTIIPDPMLDSYTSMYETLQNAKVNK